MGKRKKIDFELNNPKQNRIGAELNELYTIIFSLTKGQARYSSTWRSVRRKS